MYFSDLFRPCFDPYYKEAHSADGRSYIEKKSEGKWDVWFKGTLITTRTARTTARDHMRLLKKASPIDNAGFISNQAHT